MQPVLPRRRLLQLGLAAGLTPLLSRLTAADRPFVRSGASRFRLSLAAFSFRKYFNASDPARRLTLPQFLDYCADQGFDAAELTGYYFPTPVTPDAIIAVKRHAFLQGVAVSGTAMRSDFTDADRIPEQIAAVKTWIDHAAILGAPYLRVLAGPGAAMEREEAQRACMAAFEECSTYAGSRGVFLGLENDSGLTLKALLNLVTGVKSPWFGLNLDLANFRTNDIYADLAQCVPLAVNVHFRRTVKPLNGPPQSLDIKRILALLRAADYRGYLVLKHEEADDPYEVIPAWKREIEQALSAKA